MAKQSSNGNTQQRMEIPYFEGVNSLLSSNISKKEEASFALNARSVTIGSLEKRGGTKPYKNPMVCYNNYGLFYYDHARKAGVSNTGLFRITTAGGSDNDIYYLNSNTDNWTKVPGSHKATLPISYTFAEGCCFLVNGGYNDPNEYLYINQNGAVVRETAGHLLGAPRASLVNYYKDKIYLGSYYDSNGVKIKNGIAMSSIPLGIVTLVDGDFAAGATVIDVISVKYVKKVDQLDVYRGGTKLGTMSITSKNEYQVTINPLSFALESSDQLWAKDTHANLATKYFRWTDSLGAGDDVLEYDSIKLTGGDDDELTMMTNIGDNMIIGNQSNLAYWNDYNLKNLDLGIGCCSRRGHVKSLGTLFFLDYNGIYSTSGGAPQLISNKVEAYIKGASRSGLENAAAGKKGYSVLFSIGRVVLYNPDGSPMETIDNVVLEYNMRQQSWFVHDNKTSFDEFCTYHDGSQMDRCLFSSTSGKYYVYEYLTGSTDIIDDVEKEILFRVDTDNITLSAGFEQISYPQEIIIEIERGNGIETFVSLDTNSFYKIIGEAAKGATILKVTRRDGEVDTEARCRRMKLSIRDYSKNICKITRIAIIYTQTAEEEEQRLDTYGG